MTPAGVAVFLVGLAVRLWISRTTMGTINSDESYTSLQAAEVLRGHFPVIIPGLTYTAPFDSYVMAPVVAVFGQSPWILKLFPSLAWGLSSLALGASLRRLIGRREAFLAASLLWIAPGGLAVLATRSWESYASGMLAVTLTLYGIVRLLETPDGEARVLRRRSALVGAAGGFAFYLHPMFFAVVLPLALVPAWHFRRRVSTWWVPAGAAAFAVNLPFLLWNAKNGWPSLEQPAVRTEGPLPRLLRFFTGLVPRAYGVRRYDGTWLLGGLGAALALALLLGLVIAGVVTLLRARRRAGLLLLLPLTLAWPAMSLLTNMTFVTDGRYAIGTFPFMVAAIAIGAVALASRWRVAPQALLALWVAVLVVPFVAAESGTDLRDPNTQFEQIADYLEARGISRLAGYYWYILPIEVVSDQRIRTAVTGNPYVVLLPWTQRLVESTTQRELAYVWYDRDPAAFARVMPLESYEVVDVAGVVLYIPKEAA